jgi:iron(III) transport system permease protein
VVQSALRQLFGWRDARSYWFPDIRSLGGAIFVMSAVLYPYVYITAQASFIAQSVCVLEVSRTLGRSASQTFWQVALLLARPALAAGVALALMETLNDIGAVEFFGVRILTIAVYDTWLDRNSLAGAAQLARVMLLFVAALLLSERALRAKRRFHHTTGKYRDLPEDTLESWGGMFAALACALPVLIGFVLPASVLVHDALAHVAAGLAPEFWQAALNSLLLAGAAAVLAVGFAVVLAYARRQTRSKLIQAASTLPAISYAVPGTVLAIGLLIPLASLDNGIDALMRSLFGLSTGLLFSGTAFAIVLAYTIRFLAASLGAVEAGLNKISRNVDAAARTLGASVSEMLFKVHLPLLRSALGAAALLVFVDSMKELPATLLLRPANFDTLATQVFTPRLALSLRGGRALGAHHRSRQPRPGALAPWDHRGQPAWRLDERRSTAEAGPNGRCASLDNPRKCGCWARHCEPIGLERRVLSVNGNCGGLDLRPRQNGWVGSA